MIHVDDFDRAISGYFQSETAAPIPAELLGRVIEATSRRQPRPTWLATLLALGYSDRRTSARQSRAMRVVFAVALLALLLIAVVAAGAALRRDATLDPFRTHQSPLSAAGTLTTARSQPVVVALADGRVLVLGGGPPGQFAEILDPATGRATPAGNPVVDVQLPVATPLLDGRVLVIGWIYGDPAANGRSVAQVYDPKSDTFSATGALTTNRFEPILAGLPDGRVLVSGGLANQEAGALVSSEIYDPRTSAFTPVGGPNLLHSYQRMAQLHDGRVLVMGDCTMAPACTGLAVDIFDPATATFRATRSVGTMQGMLDMPLPVTLADGRVLFISVSRYEHPQYFGRHGIDPRPAEFFDPTTEVFAAAPPMPHMVATATLLPDGLVLVTGSWSLMVDTTTTDRWLGLYDPLTGATRTSMDPTTGIAGLTADTNDAYVAATQLPNGSVLLLTGIDDQQPNPQANRAEVFK